MATEIQHLQDEVARWSKETFGQRSPSPIIAHLRKEVEELWKEPFSTEEYADCLMLLLDAAERAGLTTDLIVKETFAKLEVNKQREWGEPDEHGAVDHIRKKND